MKANERNARFWVWWQDGWVKIKLKPGRTLEFNRHERHDEGHSFECCRYTHDGLEIGMESTSGGRDCDGYSENRYDAVCPIDRLCAVTAQDGTKVPEWRDEKTSVYDQYAQLSNY